MRLDDMDGQTFVAALRADPALSGTPVILTSVRGTRDEVTAAFKLGVVGYCLRPYSQATFQRHLTLAAHMARFAALEKAALARAAKQEAGGDTAGAVRNYAAIATAPDAAPRLFEEGLAALAARNVDGAILAFHKALAINDLYVEAHMGLARAWLSKGSTFKFRHFMKQAASACARARRFTEMRDQFAELVSLDEAGFNPFLALGNEHVRERHYTAAVALYRIALELTPNNADAYVGLSKAYHFLRRPDLARNAVGKGLALNERHHEARDIYRLMYGAVPAEAPAMTPDAATVPAGPDEEVESLVDVPDYPWLLRGVLYLAGLATEALTKPRRQAQAA